VAIALSGLDSRLRPYAEYTLAVGRAYGLNPTITSVFRSDAEQGALRRNYETCLARGLVGTSTSLTPGFTCMYPANRVGDSAHNFRLAWDSYVPGDQLALWVAIRRATGWHVPSDDLIHAEYPGWRQVIGL